MKCPKCNYVSHDYLDACRKCGVGLVAFKQEMGLVVQQPGVLDLSLVLGGVGADDLFESVEEEVIMQADDEDDFDISLDDYVEQPTARRPFAPAPRRGGHQDDLGGLDHLTLELDAADLPAELAARLRASQVIPDTPTTPPGLPSDVFASDVFAEEEETLPGRVTLDIGRDSISAELPPDVLQEDSRELPPPRPPAPPAPTEIPLSMSQETLQISRALGLSMGGMAAAAAAASLNQSPPPQPEPLQDSQPLELTSDQIDLTSAAPEMAAPLAPAAPEEPPALSPSDELPSLSFHDVSLVEESETSQALPEPTLVDPTIPTIELLEADTAVSQLDDASRAAAPEDVEEDSMLLNSFELTIDDPAFAIGTTTEAFDETPDIANAELDTETELAFEPASLAPNMPFEEVALPADHEPSLADLDTAALEAAALTFPGEEASEPPPLGAMPMSEEEDFTSSDMFALEDLDDDDATLPGHLTLEFQAPELPSTFASQMFAEAGPEATLESSGDPEAEPPTTTDPLTTSDELILGAPETNEEEVPGHLTLELDIADLPDLASTALDDIQFEIPADESPMTSASSPGEPPAHREDELLLDLDDLEFLVDDDEKH